MFRCSSNVQKSTHGNDVITLHHIILWSRHDPMSTTKDLRFFFFKITILRGKSNCKILFSCKIVKLSFKKIKIKTYFAQAHRRKYSPSCEWLAMFLFCLIYFLCTWYQQQQGHRNAATVECKRMLLTSKAEEVGGRWRLGGCEWVPCGIGCPSAPVDIINWPKLEIFSSYYSLICALCKKFGFLFIIYISIQGQLWALTHRLCESETDIL